MHIYICMYVCMYVCVSLHRLQPRHRGMNFRTHALHYLMCMCVYTYIHTHMYTYLVCTRIHIHTVHVCVYSPTSIATPRHEFQIVCSALCFLLKRAPLVVERTAPICEWSPLVKKGMYFNIQSMHECLSDDFYVNLYTAGVGTH